MTEIERLGVAIKTISEKYLVKVIKNKDTKAIAKWSLRLADYSTRLAILTTPLTLSRAEARELDEPDTPPVYDPPLTYDQEHEIFLDAEDEMLAALDRPYGREGKERGALPLYTHIEMAERLGLPLHAAEFKSFIIEGTSQ